MLEQHLIRLIEELHLPPPPDQDENARFELRLSDEMPFFLKALNPGILFTATIAPLIAGKAEDTFSYLLQANFLGQGTGGMALGVDLDGKHCILSHRIDYDVNYQRFKELAEDFANYLNYWQKEIGRLQKEATQGIV